LAFLFGRQRDDEGALQPDLEYFRSEKLITLALTDWLLLATTAFAQNPLQDPAVAPAAQESPEGGADSNPLEVVLLQLRGEYYNMNNGIWPEKLMVRSDRAFLKRIANGTRWPLWALCAASDATIRIVYGERPGGAFRHGYPAGLRQVLRRASGAETANPNII
jgi:hypothetical protein